MGELEKLALISDALDQLIPESKTTIILELNRKMFDEFNKKLNKDGLKDGKQFNIDISGTYFYFTLSEDEL
jgi:hypothetical protein